ncbi:TRAP transporter substrate-binding protein [Oceanobacter mangrovi]|uniref:TRAP transporter substrate-binding protein n=1 Tax=Oceanobacter mangrovi TaxID=2862510 RepID=UPI001FEA1C98|nr:TRAP transporter substrate-binding protein [Oceanobacter mangrovi]
MQAYAVLSRAFSRLSLFVLMVLVLPTQAEVVMRVATAGPPTHVQNAVVFATWGKWIEEATQGRVKIKLVYNMGDHASYFDLVEQGKADAAWAYHGYAPDRFHLTQIVELPNLGVNAQAASVAYWNVYQKYLAQAGEHGNLEVMALYTHGPGQLLSQQKIRRLEGIRGETFRVGGGIQKQLADLMQLNTVSASGPQVYQMMKNQAVDGVFMPASALHDYKLAEVTPYVTLMPGGFYLGSFAIFANADFMAKLTPEDRDAIRSVSGAKLSELAGKAWDESDQVGIKEAIAQGVTVRHIPFGGAMTHEFLELTKALDQKWIADVASTGVDAAEALRELRNQARSLQSQQSLVTSE